MEWMDGLSDELKGSEGLKKFTSVEGLAKSYLNVESMNGRSVRIAGPDASAEDRAAAYNDVIEKMPELMLRPNPDSPEQMKEYYTMMGVPEDAEGYSVDGIDLDASLVNELRQLAKDTNMSKTQWKTYVSKMAGMQTATQQSAEDSRVRMGAELKTVWGLAFEDRYAVVQRFLEERPGYGSVETQSPQQMVEHYETARALKGHKQMGDQPVTSARNTPDEAKAQIKEIDNNPRFRSGLPEDRVESMRLAKKRIELLRDSDPAYYAA